jgi:uncharacterized membrane protein YgaE (UPF0421/DUF939 family)
MLDQNEALAFLRLVRAERRTTRQTLQLAFLYALQAILSSALLIVGYDLTHARALNWAIISAILVIQPGIEQSLAASAVRIAANLVGGLTGLAIGAFLGDGNPQLLFALLLTVAACELLRLDLGLRTACVATVIVMVTAPDGRVTTSALERLSAVIIGCLTALLVQLLAERLRRLTGWFEPLFSFARIRQETPSQNQE